MLLAAGLALAQLQDARPAYEAASVKLNTSGSGHSSSDGSKGQVVMANQTLKRLIERAYNVKPMQVTGPSWMEDLRFDIAAKYPPDTKNDDRLPMLRTLLEDRFKLSVHRETKEMPGYALVAAKSGFKLKPVEPGGGDSMDHNGGRVQTLTATKVSMTQLADFVARTLGAMVVDKTGIDGVYNFELRWTNDDQNPTATDIDGVPSMFTALQEALGLRLQAQKVPVEVVVVDHVERVPIEN
ncbi:MAG: TIGR03435 family protein [Bryobacteraceae bacterium]